MIIRLIAFVLGTSLISCMPMPQYGMQPPQMGMQLPQMNMQPQMGMPPSQMGIPPPPPMGMTMGYGGQMMMTAPEPPYQKSPKHPIVYAPLPGEIVFKLLQNWDEELTNHASPDYQILEGNIRSAIQSIMGPQTQVTNIYFREGQVPGNPPSRPKVVVHMMVDGGSDAASSLEKRVTPDGTLGDGLKVFKDSFNAY